MKFQIPVLLPTGNQLRRTYRHYWKYRKLVISIAEEIWVATRGMMPPEPYQDAAVRVERHSSREPDIDNLYASVKPVLDALQPLSKRHPYGLGIIVDDSPRHISLDVIHVKAKKGGGKTVVEIN